MMKINLKVRRRLVRLKLLVLRNFHVNIFLYLVIIMAALACNSHIKETEVKKNMPSFTINGNLRLDTIVSKTQKYYEANIDTICSYSLPFLLISQDGKEINCKLCVQCKSYQGSLALTRHYCDTSSILYSVGLQQYYKFDKRTVTKSSLGPLNIGKHKEFIHFQFDQEDIGKQISILFSELNDEEIERFTFVFVIKNKMYFEEEEEWSKQTIKNAEYLRKNGWEMNNSSPDRDNVE